MKIILAGLILLTMVGCIAPCYAYSLDKPADVDWCTLQSGKVSFYFPTDGSDPAPTLIKLFNSANNTIDIAVYSIDNQDIANALVDATNRGIIVRIITDRRKSVYKYQLIALSILKAHNIPILINSHAGLMHMKMSIIDKKYMAMGSFDYTLEASQTNDEIMLILSESQAIQVCQDQFDRMWADENGFEKY